MSIGFWSYVSRTSGTALPDSACVAALGIPPLPDESLKRPWRCGQKEVDPGGTQDVEGAMGDRNLLYSPLRCPILLPQEEHGAQVALSPLREE